MKSYLTLALFFLAVPALMGVAHADVIAAPFEVIAASLAQEFLPWLLVGAVVGVTLFLLRKFWTKKK